MDLNLQKIVADLVGSGMTQAAIAREIGVKQPTVNRYAQGVTKECHYMVGTKLVELHRQRVNAPPQ